MKSNRRQFVQTLGTSSAGIAFSSTLSAVPTQATGKRPDKQILLVGDDIALAETQYGKVRGYVLRDMYYFLGIPYGADTSGSNRFMPPQKPKAWTDVYPALWLGNSAPQNMEGRYENKFASFRDHWNYDDVSEDCLRLNVFTPSVNNGKKRPVLFWIHGGGFTNGNGIEQDGYNGENFARSETWSLYPSTIGSGLWGFAILPAGAEKNSPPLETSACSTLWLRLSGFGTISPILAAMRQMSLLWGSPVVERKSAFSRRCLVPRVCFTRLLC